MESSLGRKKTRLALSNSRNEKDGILLRDLWDLMEESHVKEQIIWLDCCHSGDLLNFGEITRRSSQKNRCVITACHESKVAYQQLDGKHGVLSGVLIEGLNPNEIPQGEWLTDYKLVPFIQEKLTDYYQQTGISQTPQIVPSRERIKLIQGCQQTSKNLPEKQSVITQPAKKIPFILPIEDKETFTGRKDELAQLENLLLNNDQGIKVCSIAGLAGIGGIGKSALACHFATKHRDKFPDGIIGIRVDGKDNQTIAREFARRVGQEVDSEDERDAATIMQETFAHRRMLLIFDNAEDADVKRLHPMGNLCRLIITTRDKGLAISLNIPQQSRINLTTLPDPDSLELLEKLIGKQRIQAEFDAANNILQLTGNLPLAIQIIGSRLQLNEDRSLADYVNSLNEERRLVKIRGDEDNDLEACFSLSFDQLKSHEKDFFACLSVCAEEGFSRKTAMAATGFHDKYEVQDLLDYLCRLSLVNYAKTGENRFVLHTLMRVFATKKAVERQEGQLQQIAQQRHSQYFWDLVTSSNFNDISDTLADDLDDIILTAQWFKNQSQIDYQFAENLNEFFEEYGHYQKAIDLTHHFIASAQKNNDWEKVVVFNTRLVKYLGLQNKFSEAEHVLNDVSNIFSKIESLKSRQYAEIKWRVRCARLKILQNSFSEAEKILQPSLAIAEELGDKKQIRNIVHNLADIYRKRGKWDEAISMYEYVVKLTEVLDKLEDKAIALNCIGGIYQQQGQFDDALDTFEQQIEVSEELGDLKQKAIALNRIGGIYQQQGQLEQALAIFEQSLHISKSLDDLRSVDIIFHKLSILIKENGYCDHVISMIKNLGDLAEKEDKWYFSFHIRISLVNLIRRNQSEFILGEEILESIPTIISNLKADSDKQIAEVKRLICLARIYESQNRFDEAILLLKKGVIVTKKSGENQQLQALLIHLTRILILNDEFDQCLAMVSELIELHKDFNNVDELLVHLNNINKILFDKHKFKDLFTLSCETKKNITTLLDYEVQETLLNELAHNLKFYACRLYDEQKYWQQAQDLLEFSRDIFIDLNNADSLVITLNKLGLLFKQKGDYENAITTLKKSENICEDLNNDEMFARTLHILGTVLDEQKKWSEAESKFRQAYDLNEKLKDKKGQAIILNSLGQVLGKQEGKDNFDLALMCFRESIKLGQQLGDQAHLAQAHTDMGQSYRKHDQLEKSLTHLKEGFLLDEQLENRSGIEKVTWQLTYVLARLNRREEALDYCQRAIKIAPNNKPLLDIEIKLKSNQKIANPNQIIQGIIKFKKYSKQRGIYWGFIESNNDSQDIYFKEGFIDSQIIKQLKKGTLVEVEVKENKQDLRAKNIWIVDAFD